MSWGSGRTLGRRGMRLEVAPSKTPDEGYVVRNKALWLGSRWAWWPGWAGSSGLASSSYGPRSTSTTLASAIRAKLPWLAFLGFQCVQLIAEVEDSRSQSIRVAVDAVLVRGSTGAFLDTVLDLEADVEIHLIRSWRMTVVGSVGAGRVRNWLDGTVFAPLVDGGREGGVIYGFLFVRPDNLDIEVGVNLVLLLELAADRQLDRRAFKRVLYLE